MRLLVPRPSVRGAAVCQAGAPLRRTVRRTVTRDSRDWITASIERALPCRCTKNAFTEEDGTEYPPVHPESNRIVQELAPISTAGQAGKLTLAKNARPNCSRNVVPSSLARSIWMLR
jgi:hypothetical protein